MDYLDVDDKYNKAEIKNIPHYIKIQWYEYKLRKSGNVGLIQLFTETICNYENCPLYYPLCERYQVSNCMYYDIMRAYIHSDM